LPADHDHYCGDCRAYWGCPERYCHLPTEELCPHHGGGWNTDKVEHVHQCQECDGRDGEWITTLDWIHNQANCQQPREWECEKHRQTVDPCSGGCGRFVLRPAVLCADCAAAMDARVERDVAWAASPWRLRVALRVAQCLAIIGGLAALAYVFWAFEPVWWRIERHPARLILLIGGGVTCIFCCYTAMRIHQRIFGRK